MTVGFGDKHEKFTWSLFIVFCNRLLTCSISLGLQIIQRRSVLPVAPIMSYGAVSVANLVASTCQYDSLKYISFAMQTLAKCCKMLPVMLWGFLIGRQQYSASELASASAVMAGCAVFIFSGNILSTEIDYDKNVSQVYVIGIFLLLVYLVLDGFTSTWQGTLFMGYDMDTGNQVLYTTLCSTVLSFVVLVCSNEMSEAGAFLRRNPHAWVYITAVSSVATVIQYFVSYTIKVYGALNFATLMTARQFLSIIASCIIFNHNFTVGQWCGSSLFL
jgi:solute carrier family 35 (adenosine 3'-phospho 5'-phosphosulfate transporter), member B2